MAQMTRRRAVATLAAVGIGIGGPAPASAREARPVLRLVSDEETPENLLQSLIQAFAVRLPRHVIRPVAAGSEAAQAPVDGARDMTVVLTLISVSEDGLAARISWSGPAGAGEAPVVRLNAVDRPVGPEAYRSFARALSESGGPMFRALKQP